MRLIRKVIRPAYRASFNQFQELKTANETLNNVLCRIDHGSSLLCVRGKSSKAVSVSSDEALGKRKIGKKIPRNERKSMVESYVNKYREMNSGKFPTVSDTYKSVGGSYYVVRDILEELKYNSKMSSSNKMDATASPNNAESKSVSQPTHYEVPDESKSISQPTHDEVSSSVQQNNCILIGDELRKDISLSKSEGTLSTKDILDGPISKDAQNEGISFTQPTNDEGTPSLTKLPVGDISIDAETQSSQQPVAGQQQSVDSDDTSDSEREVDEVLADNAPEKKSSLWQNLKSLTSGFFDKWRR